MEKTDDVLARMLADLDTLIDRANDEEIKRGRRCALGDYLRRAREALNECKEEA